MRHRESLFGGGRSDFEPEFSHKARPPAALSGLGEVVRPAFIKRCPDREAAV